MSETTKETRRWPEESVSEAQEREWLEQQFYELFGERLEGTIHLGYPRPWSAEYRDLLRRTVEAKDSAVWAAWLDQYPDGSTIE